MTGVSLPRTRVKEAEVARVTTKQEHATLRRERWRLLYRLRDLLQGPTIVLSLAWLVLVILDLTTGLNPVLTFFSYGIWAIFVLDFLVEVLIAPRKLTYLRRHWLTAIALVLPAFGLFRIFAVLKTLRVIRLARGTRLLRVLTTANRGVSAVGTLFGERGLGYVLGMTGVVILIGAAGMLYFENPTALRQDGFARVANGGGGLNGYGDALWWTSMIMTTMGSDYWPRTGGGRILAVLLAVYAFAIFGYITANIATFFIGRSDESQRRSAADAAASSERAAASSDRARASADVTAQDVAALRRELALLRAQLAQILDQQREAGLRRSGGDHHTGTMQAGDRTREGSRV